jgi:argininosuccinate synthase
LTQSQQPRIVIAYSGSAAADAALRSAAARPPADVVTLTVDLGQGNLAPVRDRALAAGAARAHVLDAREELARQHALPALQAGIPDGGWLPLIRTLGEPLVARKLRDIADIERAAIGPPLPAHEVDANILGRVVKDGVYVLTAAAATAPDAPALVEIAFERGVPVAINDVAMPLMDLIEILSVIAGQHGVGRVETVEAPAAVVLEAALRAGTDGVVRMKLFKGTCEQVSAPVAHA